MKSFADIADRARELHAAGALPTREWSLPLVCDHLAKAMMGSTGALGPSPTRKTPSVLTRMIGRIVVLKLGIVPKGRKSPERVLPQTDITWDDAIQKLDKAVAMCVTKAASSEPWMAHPLFGFSDARQWTRFHLVHARHHFGCLRVPG